MDDDYYMERARMIDLSQEANEEEELMKLRQMQQQEDQRKERILGKRGRGRGVMDLMEFEAEQAASSYDDELQNDNEHSID